MPARARGTRQQSIRRLLALGLVVPIVLLLALWAFGTDVTVSHAASEHDFAVADQLYSGPDQALSRALTAERLQAATWLSGGRLTPLGPLRAQFRATDRAATAFLAAARNDQPVIPSAARPALRAVDSLLAGRAAVRAGVESGRLSALAAVRSYSAILAAIVAFDARLLVVDDPSLSRQAAATVSADRGVDLANGEVALLSGAVAAGGAMSAPERSLFVQDMAGARLAMSDALAVLNRSLGAGYVRAGNSAAYRGFAAIEDQIAATAGAAGAVPADASVLAATAVPLSSDYRTAQRQNAAGLTSLTTQASDQGTLTEVLVAGLGLVAVLLSIVLMSRLWWYITREVTGLRDAALALAGEQLLAEQLLAEGSSQAGDGDATAAAAPAAPGHIVEIGSARAAVEAAQRRVTQTLGAHGQFRSGASQFFHNLGLRSQALADRQLRLLELIERGTSEPQTQAGLAAVGQLSRRIRRQADGLLVLSGASSAHDNHNPIPLADLVRAATADLDDGSRITLVSDTRDAVAADAAADVMLMVAELVENAVRHTPPLTEVTVRVGRVGRGLAIEVEDRGPGIAEQELEQANALLAEPPSMVVEQRMGLLVVARLAARNGITVTLRGGPIAGTTAIVLLPHAVLVTGDVRDTIVDGSLPRVDARTLPAVPPAPVPPPVVPPVAVAPAVIPPAPSPPAAAPAAAGAPQPDLAAPPLPRRVPHPAATQPERRVAPYVPAEPAAPPAAESSAPWHWLTESQPARRPVDMPTLTGVPPGVPASLDPGAPAPLPRRIRRVAPSSEPADTAGPTNATPDAAEKDPGNEPRASHGDEPPTEP